MQDKNFFEQVGRVLKISRNDPATFLEFITCIRDMEREGIPASYKKIIRRLWPQEWQDAEDKVAFEKAKWDLLRKRRREINRRILKSELCFSFYILLTAEKEFKTIWVAEEIYHHRLQELERALSKKGSAAGKKKIEAAILLFNQKFASRETLQGEPHELDELRDTEVLRQSREPEAPGATKRKKVVFWTLALFFILVGFAQLYRYSPFFAPRPTNHQPSWGTSATAKLEKISIAVLPFESEVTGWDLPNISDGITDEIILALSRFPEMEVTARSSTLAYKGRREDVKLVGKELGVQYVVEGNLRMVNDRASVYAQISDTESGHLVWMDRWDRPFEDILNIQGDITLKILAALQVEIGEGKKALVLAKGTKNVEAYAKLIAGYDHYLKGPNMDMLLARQFCQEAIALDPCFAAAYALLAETYVGEVEFYGVSRLSDKAFDAIQQALSLDEEDPLVHLAMSRVLWFGGEHEKAMQEAEESVVMYPSLYEIIVWYGRVLTWMGDRDAAVEQLEKAVRLNPGNPSLPYLFLGYIYQERGDYARAAAYFEKNLQFKHDEVGGSAFLAACYVAMGKMKAARAAAAKVMEIDPTWNTEKFIATPFMGLKSENPQSLSDRLYSAGLP